MGELVEFKPQDKESEWCEEPARVVPIDYRTNPNWSEAHQCFIDQLPKLTDEDHHMMDVHDACQVLEAKIEIGFSLNGELERMIDNIRRLNQNSPYIMIGQAYVSLVDEWKERPLMMNYIKPIRNRDPEGRLAHYVLLLDAEEYGEEVEERVTHALREHGKDTIILEACGRVAYGNEFLEKLVEKYS